MLIFITLSSSYLKTHRVKEEKNTTTNYLIFHAMNVIHGIFKIALI